MTHDDIPAEDSAFEEGLAFAFGAGPGQTPPSVLDKICARTGARPSVSLREVERGGEAPMLDPHPSRQGIPTDLGKFKVLGLLGRGGVGVVHRGHDTDLGRDVAMKFLAERYRDHPEVLYRFVEEAQIGGQLQHPGIVPVYELGMADGRPFFTMKMVTGQTLARRLAERTSPTSERGTFLSIFERVCQTVAYAHARGVVHRDLKPANIMIGAFGEVQVVDWGMGKVLPHGGVADEERAAARHAEPGSVATVRSSGRGSPSMAGSVMGTPDYMPPEQARGDIEQMDERSDVFGLGAILCEILTGRPPYVGDRRALLEMAASARLEEAGARLAVCGADAELIALATACLAPAPAERPRSAEAVALAVQEHAAATEARLQQARVRAAAMKRTQTLGTALIAVILIGLAVSLWYWRAATVSAAEAIEARDAAAAHLADFNRLSNVVRLDAAKATERTLHPSWPDRVPAMREWLDGEAEVVCEALPDLRATLTALRARALPLGKEERAEARQSHPRAAELEDLARELEALQRARAVRAGTAEPEAFQLDETRLPDSALEINAVAWPFVDPDREVFGQEAAGLALARHALTLAPDTGDERAVVADTLAWALFANGLDEEAIEQSRAALAAASEARRQEYEGYLSKLERAVAAASGPAADAAIEDLRSEVDTLRHDVERLEWRFAEAADQFLYDVLHRLVGEIEAFARDDVRAVEKRLAWAERVEDLTITRFRERWDEARAAILAADGVVASTRYATPGLELQPQIGLVPIGMNPQSGLWEFYHPRSAWDPGGDVDPESLPIPTHGSDGRVDVAGGGIVFVLVPGGRFTMGAQRKDENAPNWDPLAEFDEAPVHEMELAPYFLSKYELTQGQWARLSGGEYPSRFRMGMKYRGIPMPIGDDHPVDQVSWEMCDVLFRRHGLSVPTEAQWERACRAGTTTPWSTGATAATVQGFANVLDRGQNPSDIWLEREPFDDGFKGPAPVGTFRPNAFGLCDMHGNVWEWCSDGYNSYEETPRPGDGLREQASTSESRVTRGGSSQGPASFARSAGRSRATETDRGMYIGVRPARKVMF